MIQCRAKIKHQDGQIDFVDGEWESTAQAHIELAERFPDSVITVWHVCLTCGMQ